MIKFEVLPELKILGNSTENILFGVLSQKMIERKFFEGFSISPNREWIWVFRKMNLVGDGVFMLLNQRVKIIYCNCLVPLYINWGTYQLGANNVRSFMRARRILLFTVSIFGFLRLPFLGVISTISFDEQPVWKRRNASLYFGFSCPVHLISCRYRRNGNFQQRLLFHSYDLRWPVFLQYNDLMMGKLLRYFFHKRKLTICFMLFLQVMMKNIIYYVTINPADKN